MRPSRCLVTALLLAALGLAGCMVAGEGGRAVYRGRGAAEGEGGAQADPNAVDSTADLPVASERLTAPGGFGPEPSPDLRAPGPVEDDPAAFQEKLDTATQALLAGEEDLALEICTIALRREPPEPYATRLRALRTEIRARFLQASVLRVDVRGLQDYVPFGHDVDLVVRLRNVGTQDVVIRPPTGSGPDAVSGSTLVLSIQRRDRDVYAAEMSRRWSQSVPLLAEGGEDLRIAPESAYEVPVRIPAEEAGQPLSGLRVLEVGGDLRAGRIEAGLEEPFGRIPIRPGRVVVVPGNYEPLAADPLGSIRKAALAVAPIHLLVATEFVPPASRPEAMAAFAEILATGSPDLRAAVLNAIHLLRQAAMGSAVRPLVRPLIEAIEVHPERTAALAEGLTALTGVSLPYDARLWVDWWRRELSGPVRLVPSDEELSGGTGPDSGPARR